ncbi:MAG: caspase family protein [Candidatus Methanosuratincola sp.]|nr:caspase family protein [Candidatus Methanosuratincola sp.]
MIWKIKLAVILISIVIFSPTAVLVSQSPLQVQVQAQTKGGEDIQDSALAQDGTPAKKHSQGIATGIPIELDQKADRWAIIIGISDYAGTINDLEYCDDDAIDFKNALLGMGWSEKNVILLLDGQATKDEILSAIREIEKKEGLGDEVVFFYSGHGSTGVANDGDDERKDECIIPYECQQDYFIWDGELRSAFLQFESQRMLFVFDSCYSGGMIDLAAPGRLVLMACGEKQPSLESSAWENGQFSYYFADQGLLNGKADLNGDDKITFEEAFDYAKANCRSQTPTASDGFAYDMLP